MWHIKIYLLALGACLLMWPCSSQSWRQARQRPTTPKPVATLQLTKPSVKAGDKVKEWYEKGLPGTAIERQPYHEFDIMIPDKGQSNSLPTSTFASRMWPGGLVPYEFGDEFTPLEKFLLEHAIWQFNTQTCVRFVPHTTEPYYITLEKGPTGCWSYTGRYLNNRFNKVNLQPHCFSQGPGMVVHELMHALGFHHEFIRPDRDQYIWVNRTATFSWAAVGKNFATKAQLESETYGTDFDYGSVMMYSRFAAAGGPLYPVMVNLKPWETDFGNRTGFSTSDLIRLNYMYCNGTQWDIAVRQPFALPIPLDAGASKVPERPTPPKTIDPEEVATLGDLVY